MYALTIFPFLQIQHLLLKFRGKYNMVPVCRQWGNVLEFTHSLTGSG